MGIRTKFGTRLARLCDAAGVSYSLVDQRAGLGRGHTAQLVIGGKDIRRGKKDPMLSTALALASAFGLDDAGTMWLFAGRGAAPEADGVRTGFESGAGHAPKVRHPAVPRHGYDSARATGSGASR